MTDTETNVTQLRPTKDRTAAERKRRSRARKRHVTLVTVAPVTLPTVTGHGVTVGTADMCGLAARLGDGRATLGDLQMAERLIMTLVMYLPPDSILEIGANEISAEAEPEFPQVGG